MTTATAISILAALFKETAYSVADNFISSDTAGELIKLASDIFKDGADAKVELEALLAEVRAHKAESAAKGEVWKPTLEQIEKHLGEINARKWGDNPSRDERFPVAAVADVPALGATATVVSHGPVESVEMPYPGEDTV